MYDLHCYLFHLCYDSIENLLVVKLFLRNKRLWRNFQNTICSSCIHHTIIRLESLHFQNSVFPEVHEKTSFVLKSWKFPHLLPRPTIVFVSFQRRFCFGNLNSSIVTTAAGLSSSTKTGEITSDVPSPTSGFYNCCFGIQLFHGGPKQGSNRFEWMTIGFVFSLIRMH